MESRHTYLEALHPDIESWLKMWGTNLAMARKRRKWARVEVQKMLLMNRRTIAAVEAGSPRVAVGAYLALQNLYGMGEEVSYLASPNRDPVQGGGPNIKF